MKGGRLMCTWGSIKVTLCWPMSSNRLHTDANHITKALAVTNADGEVVHMDIIQPFLLLQHLTSKSSIFYSMLKSCMCRASGFVRRSKSSYRMQCQDWERLEGRFRRGCQDRIGWYETEQPQFMCVAVAKQTAIIADSFMGWFHERDGVDEYMQNNKICSRDRTDWNETHELQRTL